MRFRLAILRQLLKFWHREYSLLDLGTDKMLHTLKGLVLRETVISDNAKYINILTAERGKISVLVRGAVKLTGRFTASTQLFCYSEFVVYEHNDKYSLNEATLIENYFNLCDDFDRMTVGTYILNTAEFVSNEEQPEPGILRLALNTLWALVKYKDRDYRIIKGAYEMRLCSLIGIAPNLVSCPKCGHGVEEEVMVLNIMEGTITCRHCYEGSYKETYIENDRIIDDMRTAQIIISLTPASLLAMQHSLYADMAKLFSFSLASECLEEFSKACEQYLENHVDHHFAVLDMLKGI